MPSAAPMNIDGKTGPPRNALSEKAVGERLGHDEHDQGADRVLRGVC